jgi:putative ABC transport system permease protein
MNWFENFKLAATTLWSNRLRTLLTMLGLIIGISSVILVIALGVGAQRFVREQFSDFGTNVVGLIDGGPRINGRQPLTLDDAEALRTETQTVAAIAPIAYGAGRVTWSSRKAQAQIHGVPPSLAKVIGIPIIKGRFFTASESKNRAPVVIIGQGIAKRLFGYEEPLGKTITLNSRPLVVVGVTKRGFFPGFVDFDRGIMIPQTLAIESFLNSNSAFGKRVDVILVQAKPDATVDQVTFDTTNLIRLRHKVTDKDDFSIGNVQEQIDLFNNIALGVTIVLGLTAAISLVVSGIGIMNIMLVSVTERTREIGLRKALGASEEVILAQFVIEAALLSLVGGLIGLAIGSALAMAVGAFSPLKPEITPWAVMLSIGVSLGTGLFFGVFPARRAANMDPITALRAD